MLKIKKKKNHKLKAILTDSAKEFLCLATYLNKHGNRHKLICPHTHQQNGSTERKHRHVVDTSLSLVTRTSLPRKIWGDAFISFVHIIMLPTSILKNISSYKFFFSQISKLHFS